MKKLMKSASKWRVANIELLSSQINQRRRQVMDTTQFDIYIYICVLNLFDNMSTSVLFTLLTYYAISYRHYLKN